MYDRLTEEVKKVLSYARQEALRMGHCHIGGAHLLLGLVWEGSGVAADTLKRLGVDPRALRQKAEEYLAGESQGPALDGQLLLSDAAQEAVEVASEEARQMGHGHIGPEHLLLGLLNDPDGVPAAMLGGFGVTADDVRRVETELLGETSRAQEPLLDRDLHFAPSMQEVVRLALDEARRSRASSVGLEHVVTALARRQGELVGSVATELRDMRDQIERALQALEGMARPAEDEGKGGGEPTG